MANFCHRLQRQRDQVAAVQLQGKIAGAVGNYNAHMVAHPKIDWQAAAKAFVTSLGVTFNPYTTQVQFSMYRDLMICSGKACNSRLFDRQS